MNRDRIDGQRDQLSGRIQEADGIGRDEADRAKSAPVFRN